MRVRVLRRAQAQIDQANAWWSKNRPLAPKALEHELRQALSLLAVHPAIGSPARDAKTQGVRRIYLARVHYHLYYRLYGDEIQILALWHTSRGIQPL